MDRRVVNLREFDWRRQPQHDDPRVLKVLDQTRIMIEQSVQYWLEPKLLRKNDSGAFGIVIKVVCGQAALDALDLTDPRALCDMVYLYNNNGDAPRGEPERYAGNGLCKILPTARTGMDSLALKQGGGTEFQNTYESRDVTRDFMPLGDFPHGGGVIRDNGKEGDERVIVMVGTSGFHELEDHWVSGLTADFVLLRLGLDVAA